MALYAYGGEWKICRIGAQKDRNKHNAYSISVKRRLSAISMNEYFEGLKAVYTYLPSLKSGLEVVAE